MWYRTGTVAVTANSKTVTGTGTAWVQNTRVGDGFQGPDGRLYEITNVASNGALAIDPAYRGATVSGQQYWIIPIPGYLKLLADRAAGLINSVGLLPGEVAANERRIANAEQAMLTKIGNLSGLQNTKKSQLNLGVIQSLAGEVFNTDNCSVLVNAHGVSFRHPHGLQLCYSSSLTLSFSFAKSIETSWAFPQPFIAPGAVLPIHRGNGANQINWPETYVADISYASLSNNSVTIALAAPSGKSWSANSSATDVRAFAIGLWKQPAQ